MTDKDSFIMYTNYKVQIDKLTDEQAGILFKAIMRYQTGEELPEMDDITDIVFSMIKFWMDSDSQKYSEMCQKRSEAGKMGGRPKKQLGTSELSDVEEKPKKANGFSENQKKQPKAKKADNDNDNDNENDNENDNDNDNVVAVKTSTSYNKTATAEKEDFQYLGEYKNVKVTSEFLKEFREKYKFANSLISDLSEFKNKKGIKTTSHDMYYLKKFAEEDKETRSKSVDSFDTDEFFEVALKKSYGKDFWKSDE